MFYQGDLESGIIAAVQQSKLVTCFVRGDDSDIPTYPVSTEAKVYQMTKRREWNLGEWFLQEAAVGASHIDRIMGY